MNSTRPRRLHTLHQIRPSYRLNQVKHQRQRQRHTPRHRSTKAHTKGTNSTNLNTTGTILVVIKPPKDPSEPTAQTETLQHRNESDPNQTPFKQKMRKVTFARRAQTHHGASRQRALKTQQFTILITSSSCWKARRDNSTHH